MWFSVNITGVLIFSMIAILSYTAIYRLILSPIAHIPGPKLAALTFLYEAYHDVYLRGQYNKHLLQLHQKYGPVVRISPYEVHILDADFYDTIYCLGNKRVDKWYRQMRGFSANGSAFGTVDHARHHARREPLATSFSKRAVVRLEPVIRSYIHELCSCFEHAKGNGKPINLFHAYSALTGDIINDYSFGVPSGFLKSQNFSADWYNLVMAANRMSFFFKYLGDPDSVFRMLPKWLNAKLYPLQLVQAQQQLRKKLLEVRDGGMEKHRTTVFHEIFASDLPPSETAVDRLVDEAFSVTAAGTITTADTLAVMSYHIISNPDILARLQNELSTLGTEYTLPQLEQLPFLTAVIKEGLRLACGVTSRLARIFVDSPLQYGDWIIPAGTPVSMCSQLIHYDAGIFPEPHSFKPDRWLHKSERRLENYIVSFSKGSRQCVGLNLAYAEMYLTLAAVFAPGTFTMELFETTGRDAEVVADVFVPGFRMESKGIRMVVE